MKRITLFACFFALSTLFSSIAQQTESVSFKFKAGNNMFFMQGNEAELERLYDIITQYKDDIVTGQLPVYVDGYCASLPTARENINIAFIRANRVKSELIIHKGLLEKHFRTKNYATAYEGDNDLVVVTLRIPEKIQKPVPQAETNSEPKVEPVVKPLPKTEPVAERPTLEAPLTQQADLMQPDAEPVIMQLPQYNRSLNNFDLRTNLLYDAMLTPTLGVEWYINRDWGIKLDGSYAHWGNKHGMVHNIWLINPEIRRYMGNEERFYLSIGGNIGRYNIYKGVIGSLFFPDETGYQGGLYSGSLGVGYKLALNYAFSLDFNLGLGYTYVKYDSFTVPNRVRVYKAIKEQDVTKNLWGPTQAGVSLVWKPGSDK